MQLQGSTDREVWLGHCAGTSVASITGPQSHWDIQLEVWTAAEARPKHLLAEQPEAAWQQIPAGSKMRKKEHERMESD